MKKTISMFLTLVLCLSMVVGFAPGAVAEVEKPEQIVMMTNGTFYTQENYRAEWEARFEELTGIDLVIIQPDHSSYDEVVNQNFAAGEYPDVVLLGASMYSSYASEGVLWDMTDAWNNSEAKKNMSAGDVAVQESLMLDGRIYGMTRGRGNGTVTYIKKAWLDNVNMSIPTNYEEYLAICDAFTHGDPDNNGVDGDTIAVAAAGLIGPESPWINYFPEFYQDAYPSFYINEEGKWVDGFTEPAMKEALLRMRDAYEKGYIDPQSLTYATSDVRNRFYENKTGIFTYWAGKWAGNLYNNLKANGWDPEIVACPPIAEVGTYIDRCVGGYCITSACENPEGVFKYFFEPMFDGGELQELWLFGVEGVHWSDKAETLNGVTYTDGQLHGLDSKEKPGTSYAFDCLELDIGVSDAFKATHQMVNNPGVSESQAMFNANSRAEQRIISTEEMSMYNGDLLQLKKSLIANVVANGADFDEEYAAFVDAYGEKWSQAIVDSLNNR